MHLAAVLTIPADSASEGGRRESNSRLAPQLRLMASTYALPIAHHGHSHSHSRSPIRSIESAELSPHTGASTQQLRKEASTDSGRAHGYSHSHPIDHHDHGGCDSSHQFHSSNSQLCHKYSSTGLSPSDGVMSATASPETQAAVAYPNSNGYDFPSISGRASSGDVVDRSYSGSQRYAPCTPLFVWIGFS